MHFAIFIRHYLANLMFLFHFYLFQTGNKRGSFLARDSSTLEKLAEMTKGTSSTKAGSGPKHSKNFIFAALSPPKAAAEESSEASSTSSSKEATEKRKKSSAKKSLSEPLNKKLKMDRSIDENSRDTIFGAFWRNCKKYLETNEKQ